MNNDMLKKAYDSMTPDEAARQRMLSAVLAQSGESSGGKYCSYAAAVHKQISKPAYAVIAAMLLLVTGILAGPGLWNAYTAWNAANEATEPVNYEDPTDETQNTNAAEAVGADDWEIIERTEYYVIAESGGLYRYVVYDTAGNIALSIEPLTIMPQITVVENRLVRIATQAGTGVATNAVQYYDLERNMISQVYHSVFSECGNLVAWATHEKVIVRDIFDDNGFYQELTAFSEPFSQVAFPFVSVAFTEDGFHVSVTYLSGPDYTEVSEVFRLKKAEVTPIVTEYELYNELLNQFQTGIADNWDWLTWNQNNIVLPENLDPSTLGYALIDLDGYGAEELIITDGDTIYGLCKIIVVEYPGGEQEVYHSVWLEQNNWIDMRLCEGNVILVTDALSQWNCNAYRFYRMNDYLLDIEMTLYYTEDEGWFAGRVESEAVPIMESEANAIIASYNVVEIEMTPFVQ